MELHPDLARAIDTGAHGHLVTIGADGRPQVSVIWLGRDGNELLIAHLGAGQKIRNIERDPRVAISIEVPGTTETGLRQWAVFHGSARLTEGGGPDLLQQLAPRFLGPGIKFPPTADPPPGRIIHVTIERVTGAGPWA
jgi:PPOX class probable F420-dependent enzyme